MKVNPPITHNKQRYWILLSIFLVLVTILAYSLKSLSIRRTWLIAQPMPIPEYLTRVRPRPGSSTSVDEFNRSIIPHWGEVCFNLKSGFLLDPDPNKLSLDVFQHFELRINGKLPPAYLPDQAESYSIDPYGHVCWNVVLQPGDYLVELIINGEMNKKYEWAFSIIEN